MTNSVIMLTESFFVHVDGSVYSEHNYFSDALKTAMKVANIFRQSHVEVISSKDAAEVTAGA